MQQPGAQAGDPDGVAGEALLTPSATRRLIQEFTRQPMPGGIRALDGITSREHDVLLLIGQGLSNSEICEHLHITMATAKTNIGRLLAKLDARDRPQLVIAAYQSGLVNAPPMSGHPPRPGRGPS